MSEIKQGDRVRVEYEGVAVRTYTSDLSGTEYVTIKRDGGTIGTVRAAYVAVIEPAYEVGSVYVSPNGRLWYRLSRDGDFPWRDVAVGTVASNRIPMRPLTKLTPEA